MSKIIRIGTRDSALALWQAKTVQSQLQHLGHECVLVPVKSTGDLVLNKPIYELGITGVFTRTLDIALLNEDLFCNKKQSLAMLEHRWLHLDILTRHTMIYTPFRFVR